MSTEGASARDDRRPALRWLPGLAALLLAGLLAWIVAGWQPWRADSLLPWEQARFRLLLWAATGWVLLVAILAILSQALPSIKPLGMQFASRRGPVLALLALLVTAFILAYGWLAFGRHLRFNSTAFDLAIHEQVIWNTLRGRFFASSVEVDNRFADHFSPFMMVPGVIYALLPSPLTLVGVQVLAMALGVIPLYRLARRRLESGAVALALSAAYLLYPATGFILRFDFHTEAFAVPAFLAAFEAMDRGSWKAASLWLLLPLLSKESLGLTVAGLGLYALLVRKKPSWGLAWLVVGLGTFFVTSFWLIPTMRGEASDTLSRYGWLGGSPGEIVKTVLTSPGQVWRHLAAPRRQLYLVQLLVPVGFLGLFAPLELALALPGLLVNLLSEFDAQSTIYFQYTAAVVPFVFISAVFGAQRLRSWLRAGWTWQLAGLALIPLAAVAFLVDSPFREQPALSPLWDRIDNAAAVNLALQAVPETGSVVTTNAYAPHLARRTGLYIIGIPAQRKAPLDPDVVFFNLHDLRWSTCKQYRSYLSKLLPEEYGVTFHRDGVVVIERGGGSNQEFIDLIADWRDCAQ